MENDYLPPSPSILGPLKRRESIKGTNGENED